MSAAQQQSSFPTEIPIQWQKMYKSGFWQVWRTGSLNKLVISLIRISPFHRNSWVGIRSSTDMWGLGLISDLWRDTVAVSDCLNHAGKELGTWHPFFQGHGIVCFPTWNRWPEIPLSSIRQSKTTTWPCLTPPQIRLESWPLFAPFFPICIHADFHLDPVFNSILSSLHEVTTVRYRGQECQKHMSKFSLWITLFKYYHSWNIFKLSSLHR